MLSGIGPASLLTSLNIPVIIDNPSVGQNLTDHPLNIMYYTVKKNTTVDRILQNQTVFAEALQQWNETGKGPMSNTASNTIAFQKLPADSPAWTQVNADPAAGKLSGNTELLFGVSLLILQKKGLELDR